MPATLGDFSRHEVRAAQQLLATLVNHPSILIEVGEEVAELQLPVRDLDRLRAALLDFAAAHPDLDSDAVKCHLSNQGFSAVLDRLLHRSVYQLAQFARPDSAVAESRAAVSLILEDYRGRRARQDAGESGPEHAEDPDAEVRASSRARH